MKPLSRRQLLGQVLFAATAASLPGLAQASDASVPAVKSPTGTVPSTATQTVATAPSGPFTLPPLPYAYDALEPHIDTETMKVHHDKHHAAYVAKLNAAVAGQAALAGKTIDEILLNGLMKDNLAPAIRNNGGGHYNHSLFWQTLEPMPPVKKHPIPALTPILEKTFGSVEKFQQQFNQAALNLFGSGWVWLSLDSTKKLQIESTPNQDNPLMFGRQPVFGLDVWEHAYYLKHENRRPEYIEAFWNVVNWDFISARYEKLAA
jgi:superoxide dismutase, Fe-Mn family